MNEQFIQDNFCDAEISQLLKEVGFNEPCLGFWSQDGFYEKSCSNADGYFMSEGNVAAPLFQQAINWLNEVSDKEKLPTAYIKDFDLRNPVLVAKEIEDSISEIKFIRAARLKSQQSTH